MNTIQTIIEKEINDFVDKIIAHYESKHDLDKDVILSLWGNGEKTVSKRKSSKVVDSSVRTCPYVFTGKSKRVGESCGSKLKDGCNYCGVHKKHDTDNNSVSSSSKTSDSGSAQNKKIMKHKELNVWYHPTTSLVFEKKTIDGKIVGQVVGVIINDKVSDKLHEKDIENAKKYGFPVQSNVIKTEDDLESDEE